MTSWRGFTIRSHLVVLVLATLLPVLIFTGFMLLEYVKLQHVELNRGMTDTARALSLAVDREIGRVRAVVETLATSTYLDSKDFERFYEASSRAAKTIEGSWIVLFDRSGQQITNTLRPFAAGLPNTLYEATPAETADSLPRGAPESIRQVVATGKPVVTDLFIGIVSKRPSISISVPVIRDGQVLYVLNMGIRPSQLAGVLVEQRILSGWFGAIVGRNGIIIARQPDSEKFVGRPLTPELGAAVANRYEGTGIGTTWEGTDLYGAFSRSRLTGWAVAVGAPMAAIDAPVRRSFYILAAGAVALTLIALAIALFLGKRISAPLVGLASSAGAIQQGIDVELAPSNVSEIALLHSELVRSAAEREQLEDKLRQAQKLEAVGTLAGGIAHDFNNTLNIIQAYALLIREQASTDKRIVENAQVIEDEVQRGAAVVRQLMTIGRKTETTLVPTDINRLVLTIRDLIKQTFPKTIDIRVKLEQRLKAVLADSNQITQALLNVCLNSRDAMPHGGALILSTEQIDSHTIEERYPEASGRHVLIAVSDEGSGMEKSVRSRALEPFFTTKPVGEGTGLGLAMVYGILRNHNGFMDIISEPGVGTTVRLYLPAALEEEVLLPSNVTGDARMPAVQSLAQNSTILVAEDETSMVEFLRNALSRVGLRVLVATDGLEAIDLYQRHRNEIDLVLMDLGLPKLSGLDVVKALKQLDNDITIVVSTGYLDPALKTQLIAAGVKDYIEKPYVIPDVLQRISRILAGADSSKEPSIH